MTDNSNDLGNLSPELKKLKDKMKKEREDIVLYKKPVKTCYNFTSVIFGFFHSIFLSIRKHPVRLCLSILTLVLWIAGRYVEGPHTPLLDSIWFNSQFVVWWTGLGVLSSVGLGTGMHSGFLFLFPFIMKVCLAAEECNSLSFHTRSEMWFRDSSVTGAFHCPENVSPERVRFLAILAKVFFPSFLWGTGTAIGEIPPYFVSYLAAKAGKKNEEFDEEISQSKKGNDVISRMKLWMIDLIDRLGFWGIVLLSAWPNMAFDLCGICCGQSLMPFWKFFGGSFVGKALLKVNFQAMFLITVFSKAYLDVLLMVLNKIDSLAGFLRLESLLNDGVKELRQKFHDNTGSSHAPKSLLAQVANYGMVALIAGFGLSCVHQFAQNYQMELDKKKLMEKKKSN